MTGIDDAWEEQRRSRSMRTSAHLYIRHDAYRFMPPGSPLYAGRDVVKYFWPDQSSQPDDRKDAPHNSYAQAWTGKRGRWMPDSDDASLELQQDRELAEIRANLLELKSIITTVRRDLAWRRFQDAFARYVQVRLKANFNPAQPRVPAGNPDGGEWTSTGGSAGRNYPRIISDATPDNLWKPGAQYAQDATQRRYSVILREEEARGGHAIRDHVGKNDEELLARVRVDQGQAGIYYYARKRHGSFESTEAANDFVNRTLEQNKSVVDLVASGRMDRYFVTARFGYVTGREAFRPNPDAGPYLRNTYGVGVEIRRDTSAQRGYRVITAYPRND